MTTVVRPAGLAPVRQLLDNGVVVLAKEARTTPAVTIHASLQAGGIYEPAGTPGLSFFLSRVIDRGTLTRTADQIAVDLDQRGVTLNVNVTRHVLSLTCACLVEDFDVVLQLIADIIRHPSLPDAEITTRRGEIVTMIRQDEDNPGVMATEGLLAMLYPDGHPYGRRAKGDIEVVEAITRDDLVRLHHERMAPSGMSLVIVGDVTPQRAIAAAEEAFGTWSAAPPPRLDLPRVVPAARRQERVIRMMNKAQADIAYGFTTIARNDPAYYAYLLMNNVLGQYGLGGRLGDSIRERQGMAYYVFSAFDANIVEGPLMVRAGVNPANVDRAIASIDAEVAAMAANGVTEKELADAKQYLIGSMPRNLETNAGIASFLQTIEFFQLGLDYDLRLPGLLSAVTRDEVHEAAQRSLSAERASLVIAGPYTPPGSAVDPYAIPRPQHD